MSGIGKYSSIQNKRRANYTAIINTTEQGKYYEIDVRGLTETEKMLGGNDNLPPPSPQGLIKQNGTIKENQNANQILESIRQHLNNFSQAGNLSLQGSNDILTVGENKISVRCFLHKISNDPDFLKDQGNECTNAIRNYQSDGTLDLDKLMKLSNNFQTDSNFYDNLYGFNIALVNFITHEEAFKNAKPETKANVINGVQRFIRQSLRYLSNYMVRYNIISEKLVNSSYDLLYLLNILTAKHIIETPVLSSLNELYQRLISAVQNNIKIYNQINKDAIGKEITVEQTALPQIDQLKNELESLIDKLQNEHKILQRNVANINNNTDELANYASEIAKNAVK